MSDTDKAFRELWIIAQIIADNAQDEGDRVYFGSTNQLDNLKETLHRWRYHEGVGIIVYGHRPFEDVP